MSILIPGMGMPRKCNDCLFERWECEYGYYCLVIPYTEIGSDWTEAIRKTGRREDCPLVIVPPHGRLIDADALMENAQYKGTHDIVTAWDIVNAPTIIPADKEGEGC